MITLDYMILIQNNFILMMCLFSIPIPSYPIATFNYECR